jgi:hypothetical protein
MVEDKFKQAQDFRDRADRLRAIAGAVPLESERALLMQLAEEYDAMARSAAVIGNGEVAEAIRNSDGHRAASQMRTPADKEW